MSAFIFIAGFLMSVICLLLSVVIREPDLAVASPLWFLASGLGVLIDSVDKLKESLQGATVNRQTTKKETPIEVLNAD